MKVLRQRNYNTAYYADASHLHNVFVNLFRNVENQTCVFEICSKPSNLEAIEP